MGCAVGGAGLWAEPSLFKTKMWPKSSVKFSNRETKQNLMRNLKEEASGEVCGMTRLDWFAE
jgi:hypothetical protein